MFQCSFDGAAFAACTSPKLYALAGGGGRTVQVRAIDPAGTPTPRRRATSRADLAAPDTTITAGLPSNSTRTRGSRASASRRRRRPSFEHPDWRRLHACTSLKSYTGLTAGSHTFQVRATDPAGNTRRDAHEPDVDDQPDGAGHHHHFVHLRTWSNVLPPRTSASPRRKRAPPSNAAWTVPPSPPARP